MTGLTLQIEDTPILLHPSDGCLTTAIATDSECREVISHLNREDTDRKKQKHKQVCTGTKLVPNCVKQYKLLAFELRHEIEVNCLSLREHPVFFFCVWKSEHFNLGWKNPNIISKRHMIFKISEQEPKSTKIQRKSLMPPYGRYISFSLICIIGGGWFANAESSERGPSTSGRDELCSNYWTWHR